MDVLSTILIKKPRKTKKKLLEDFKIISPTSPLKQQIKEALDPEIELLSNQRPKIIIVEEKPLKAKTRKSKPSSPKEKVKKVTKKKAPSSPKHSSPKHSSP